METTSTPTTKEATMALSHTTTAVVAFPANEAGRGNLAGFRSSCSCGLEMASTIRTNVLLDVADHLRWAAAQSKSRKAR